MIAREFKAKTAFARKAAVGRGVSVEEAVAAAEARIEGVRAESMERIGALVGRMQAARAAVAVGDTQAYSELKAAADALVGLGGLFALPELGRAAFSLCALFDAARPGAPGPQEVVVHIDAVQLFWSASPEVRAASAEHVLAGLGRVAALPAKRA